MRKVIALVIAPIAALLLGAGGGSDAGKLPPIGQRTYVIDGSRKHAPVTIAKDGEKAKVFLKDPVHPNAPMKLAPAKPKALPVKKAAVVRERSGQLRFGAVNVSGHIRRPRVEFARDTLPVERADELQAPDFFQKIYEPASDYSE